MSGPFTQGPIDQVSAIPFRGRDQALEFCLITSIRKRRWGFPKGIIDPGETFAETALKEAREEAGLIGQVVGPPLGKYRYHKWGTDLLVTVVLMEVSRSEEAWDEAELRERRWVRADEAEQLLTSAELKPFLAAAITRLTRG